MSYNAWIIISNIINQNFKKLKKKLLTKHLNTLKISIYFLIDLYILLKEKAMTIRKSFQYLRGGRVAEWGTDATEETQLLSQKSLDRMRAERLQDKKLKEIDDNK
jgi:hypothetical protein